MRVVEAQAGDTRWWATGMVYRTRVLVPDPHLASQGDQSDQSLTGQVPVAMGMGSGSQSRRENTYAGWVAKSAAEGGKRVEGVRWKSNRVWQWVG